MKFVIGARKKEGMMVVLERESVRSFQSDNDCRKVGEQRSEFFQEGKKMKRNRMKKSKIRMNSKKRTRERKRKAKRKKKKRKKKNSKRKKKK
jgi:hypothetical protein